MNPAALQTNLDDLRPGGILIVDREAFNEQNLQKAGYDRRPARTTARSSAGSSFRSTSRSSPPRALKDLGLSAREVFRCRNFFCLGVTSWLYPPPDRADRGVDPGQASEEPRWSRPTCARCAPGMAFARERRAARGLVRGEAGRDRARDVSQHHGQHGDGARASWPRRNGPAGRSSSAATRSRLPATSCTSSPALKQFDVVHLPGRGRDRRHRRGARSRLRRRHRRHHHERPRHEPESRDARAGAGRRAAADRLDIQRAGPSTGMPTKTEQADLLMAMYGRHGEAPVPILAPATPSDCFAMAFEAVRIAVKYMTPVILLSDGYLANGAEPWLIPDPDALPTIPVAFRTDPAGILPVRARRGDAVAAVGRPGTPGLEHRIGGLEKEARHRQRELRAPEPRADDAPARAQDRRHRSARFRPPRSSAQRPRDLLVVGWGSTFGAIRQAVRRAASRRAPGCARAPPPPEPAAVRSGRHPAPLRGTCWCPRSTWDSWCACCAPSSWSTRSASTRSRAGRSRSARSSPAARACSRATSVQEDVREVQP